MSLSSYPLISVLMPSYNHSNYIGEAVESVTLQSYPNLELVVVDDASTDGSQELLLALQSSSKIPFKLYFNRENHGPVRTVNFAFSKAEGDLVVPFASDDLFLPDAFIDRARLFYSNDDLKIIFSNGRFLRAGGQIGTHLHTDLQKRLLSESPPEILEYLYTNSSPLYLQTTLIRRDFLQRCGAYDQSSLADDWAMNIRMFQNIVSKNEYRFVDRDIFLYRIHGDNLNRDMRRHIDLKLQMINKYTPIHLKRLAKANIYWEIGHSLIGRNPVRALLYLSASQMILPQPRKILLTMKAIMSSLVHRIASRWSFPRVIGNG